MAFEIYFDQSTQIISVKYTGATTLESKLRAVRNVVRDYPGQKHKKLLIDVRDETMEMSLKEQEGFGEYLSNHLDLRNAKVAVLHEPDFNPNSVIDVISYKNGYQLAQFTIPEKAMEWLMHSKSK